jgi:hypothetical protein
MRRISRRLDEELRAEHDLSLAEYDALLLPSPSASDRRIRMRQLADRSAAQQERRSPASSIGSSPMAWSSAIRA